MNKSSMRYRPRWGPMEANLKARLGTGFVAIPLLVLLVGWGSPWLFAAVFFIVTVAALREFFVMTLPGRSMEQLLGVVFGSVLSLLLFFPGITGVEFALSIGLILVFLLYVFTEGQLKEKLIRLAWTLVGALYLGYLLPHWVVLFRMPRGRDLVLFVLLVIMTGDTTAYFIGKRFGAKKLAPKISPGKTVEGAWAYLGGSAVAGVLGAVFLMRELTWPEALFLSIILSVLGQLGDLFESWIKRAAAVKDSGAWFPGHGGLLDRLDSLIFPAVFTSLYLKVFHP
jgi:phosphatidate cytidylyltransferase